MPKNVTRARVKAASKYLRKSNGQFNGSLGSGDNKATGKSVKAQSSALNSAKKIELERQRLRGELKPAQLRKLDRIVSERTYTKPMKATDQAKALKKQVKELKKQIKSGTATDPLASFNLKVLEQQQLAASKTAQRYKALKQDKALLSQARRVQKKFDAGKPITTGEYKLLQLVASEARANVDRAPIEGDSFKVAGNRVKIWDGKQYGQYKDTQFRRRKEYDYSVGGESLNRNRGVMIHKGETVLGVPDNVKLHKRFNNEQLIGELATSMRYVENHDKGVKAPAPYWHAESWGKLTDESKMGKPGNYGQAQLHHINQWAKTPLDSIVKSYQSGEITLDEAKKLTRDNLRPTPNGKPPYEIAAAPQKERAYVVLPGGLHDLTSSHYYDLSHPKGIHPDTGELFKVGLPDYQKTGSPYGLTEGREYHNGVRDSYWGEWHRQNAHTAVGEVNRRLRTGQLTTTEFERIMKDKIKRASK